MSTLRGTYKVIVKIENKPFIKDPEGEVILRDLLMKNDYKQVSNVSTAKLLKFEVKADNSENAKKELSEKLSIKGNKVDVIHLGVDISKFNNE